LDPKLPEAELAWAMAVLYGDRDLEAARGAFVSALALDRGNAEAHYYYAQYLTAAGRFDEALQASREAQALDPFSPLIHHYVGRILHFAGKDPEAVEHLARTLELEPNYPWALLFTANAYEDLGTYAEATRFRQRYWSAMGVPPDRVNRLGQSFAAGGYPAVRREWIDWIEGFARSSGFVTSTELAMLYGWLGEKDQAFKWLEKAVDAQTRDLIYLRVTPELAPLRSDPRFDAIAARVFPFTRS
jgi:tetratricopeptide (TPR) repeat protein